MMLGDDKPQRLGREYPGPIPPCVMIRAKNRDKTNPDPDRLILESRKKNDKLEEMRKEVEKQVKSDFHTEWFRQAEIKTKYNDIRTEMGRQLGVHHFDLERRRERLREKLHQEERDLIEAMEEAEETTLERQAKMRARVKTLRENREKERLQFVQEKYDQQFRDQCDELRSELSKREENRVLADRREQVKERKELAKEQKAQDDMFVELWEKDRLAKEAREEREAMEDLQKKQELLDIQQKQMARLEAQREEARKLKEDETQLLREQEAMRKLEDQKAEEEKRRRQVEARQVLDTALSSKMLKRAREEQEELAFELKMLEQMLEESRNEARERKQRKIELREEDRRYREYLARLLEEEKQQQKELEALQKQHMDANYQKQVDRWRSLHKMRKALLDEVITGRNKQLEERLAENERQRAQNAKDHEDLLRNIQEQNRIEEERALKRRENNLKYQDDLQGQIRYREEQEQERKRFLDYEYRMGQQAEKEYRQKVQEILEKPHLDRLHPMRRAAGMMSSKGGVAFNP